MAFGSTGGGVAGAAAAPAPGAAPAPAARPRPPAPPPRASSQMPEKSTLPSAVRGGGPVSTGLRSARGTPGVGNDGHWAWTEAERARAIARAAVTRIKVMSVSGDRVYRTLRVAPSAPR